MNICFSHGYVFRDSLSSSLSVWGAFLTCWPSSFIIHLRESNLALLFYQLSPNTVLLQMLSSALNVYVCCQQPMSLSSLLHSVVDRNPWPAIPSPYAPQPPSVAAEGPSFSPWSCIIRTHQITHPTFTLIFLLLHSTKLFPRQLLQHEDFLEKSIVFK